MIAVVMGYYQSVYLTDITAMGSKSCFGLSAVYSGVEQQPHAAGLDINGVAAASRLEGYGCNIHS
jgi:hypothetical protein